MRTREKKLIVRLFLDGWSTGKICAYYWNWVGRQWTRDIIEAVLREALKERGEP